MSLEVLTRSLHNVSARAEMSRRGLNLVTPWYLRAMHKSGIVKGVNIGDLRKSWDVLKTVQFVEENVSKASPILDIGAYASEILCIFRKLGFADLTGIDLNPKLKWMPHADAIKYVQDDCTRTSFPPKTFNAITAISVLEHGFSENEIFREMARLLTPGGYFVGSIDYWPEKVDTSDVRAFGLDWRIFSKAEVLRLIEQAHSHGLLPIGELSFRVPERTVSWFGREYTFAWFAFQKHVVS